MARANGLALQVHFTIGAHDNPHSRHGKPHFPVEDTEVQGREATGLGLTAQKTSICVCRKGQVTLRPASGAGESLDLNMLFLDICCLSWLLRLVHWAHVHPEHLVQEAQMAAHLATGL